MYRLPLLLFESLVQIPEISNGYHDLLMLFLNVSDIAIVTVQVILLIVVL